MTLERRAFFSCFLAREAVRNVVVGSIVLGLLGPGELCELMSPPTLIIAPATGPLPGSLVECVDGAHAESPQGDGEEREGGEERQHIRTTHRLTSFNSP